MNCLAKFLILVCFALSLTLAFAVYSSEDFNLVSVSVGPSGVTGSSEDYTLLGVSVEGIGSGLVASEDYNLWVGFPSMMGIPRKPAGLTAVADSTTQIMVSWDSNGNPGGVSYQLQRVSPTTGTIYSGTSTSYANSGLIASTEYCYRVRAHNSAFTPFTARVCATTDSVPPFIYNYISCTSLTGADIYSSSEDCPGVWRTVDNSNRCCSVKCVPAGSLDQNGGTTGEENGGGASGGDGGEEDEEGGEGETEIVLEKEISEQPTEEEILEVLREAGVPDEALEEAAKKVAEAAGTVEVSRSIKSDFRTRL